MTQMTQMTQLSPLAAAVMDAVYETWVTKDAPGPIAAAALRILADNVVPEDYASYTGHVEYDQGLETRNDAIRESILNIVTELENTNN